MVRLQLVRGTLLRRRAFMLNRRAFWVQEHNGTGVLKCICTSARLSTFVHPFLSAVSVCLLRQESQRAAAAKFVSEQEHRRRIEDAGVV